MQMYLCRTRRLRRQKTESLLDCDAVPRKFVIRRETSRMSGAGHNTTFCLLCYSVLALSILHLLVGSIIRTGPSVYIKCMSACWSSLQGNRDRRSTKKLCLPELGLVSNMKWLSGNSLHHNTHIRTTQCGGGLPSSRPWRCASLLCFK